MKAKDLQKGDVIFTADFPAVGISDLWYAADDIITISFDNNSGMQLHPERELLVSRGESVL